MVVVVEVVGRSGIVWGISQRTLMRKRKKWDEILGKKKEKESESEAGPIMRPRSEKEKRFYPHPQGVEPSRADGDDEETVPKRPLENSVELVTDGYSAMTIIESPLVSSASVLSSNSKVVDDFKLLVAAEEEKEDEFEFV